MAVKPMSFSRNFPPVEREQEPTLWQTLLSQSPILNMWFAVMMLTFIILIFGVL